MYGREQGRGWVINLGDHCHDQPSQSDERPSPYDWVVALKVSSLSLEPQKASGRGEVSNLSFKKLVVEAVWLRSRFPVSGA